MAKFKVGDFIKALGSADTYTITNTSMIKGRVSAVSPDGIRISIIIEEHENRYLVGQEHQYVLAKHFEFFTPQNNYEIREESYGTFITINDKYTIFTKSTKEEISIVDVRDIEPNVQTAKLIALSNTK